MNALMLQLWRTCQYSVAVRKMVLPVEHFLDIVQLQQADAENILLRSYRAFNKRGWDFTEQPHSWVRSGVYARMKNFAPHGLFVHCHCQMLQLACFQAVNSMPGISTLQRKQEVQHVLDFPELKLINPSNTCWLAHERGEGKLCCNCDCS